MSVDRSHHRNPLPHRTLRRGMQGADVDRFRAGMRARIKRSPFPGLKVPRSGPLGDQDVRAWHHVRWIIGLPATSIADGHPLTVGAQLAVRQPGTRLPAARRRAKQRRAAIAAERADRLTKDFAMSEFDCKDGTPVPAYMRPHLKRLCERVLQPLRDEFGPCTITSGFRTEQHNANVGGEDRSFHVYTDRRQEPAGDATFARGTPDQWGARARELLGDSGGVGIYPDSRFVHVDTRNGRSDWRG